MTRCLDIWLQVLDWRFLLWFSAFLFFSVVDKWIENAECSRVIRELSENRLFVLITFPFSRFVFLVVKNKSNATQAHSLTSMKSVCRQDDTHNYTPFLCVMPLKTRKWEREERKIKETSQKSCETNIHKQSRTDSPVVVLSCFDRLGISLERVRSLCLKTTRFVWSKRRKIIGKKSNDHEMDEIWLKDSLHWWFVCVWEKKKTHRKYSEKVWGMVMLVEWFDRWHWWSMTFAQCFISALLFDSKRDKNSSRHRIIKGLFFFSVCT